MSFVQAIAGDNSPTNTTSLALTLPTPSTAGSMLIFACFSGSFTSVTDDHAQTYTTAGSVGSFVQLYYCPNSVAGVSVITGTCTSSPVIAFAIEESGVVTTSAEDAFAMPAVQTGVTSFTSGNSGTTTNANDVAYGVHASNTGNGLTWTAGSGWTPITGTNITGGHHLHTVDGDEMYVQRKTVTATGAYASDGTVSSANNIGSGIVLFKQAAAASPALQESEWHPMEAQSNPSTVSMW
jgi:hypothetical protein